MNDIREIINKTLHDLPVYEPLCKELREQYLDLIEANSVPRKENISNDCTWLTYVFYCYIIVKLCPETSVVVDWGGSLGHICQILKTGGFTHTNNYLLKVGDHVEDYYPLFESKFNISTITGNDPNRLNLESDSTDIIISSGVLEHVREDGTGREDLILSEIHRALRPGGLFIAWKLPARLGISELAAKAVNRWHHQYRYTRTGIVKLLADFQLLHLEKHGFVPGTGKKLLERFIKPASILRYDYKVSRLFPFNIFANDFFFIARKPGI